MIQQEGGPLVAAMCIRNLDDRVMELLRARAERHGRSREAEARAILAEAVRDMPRAAEPADDNP